MNKDSHLLFEAYKKIHKESMPYPEFAKLSKHANSKLPEDKPKEKLKYDYEIVAYLPRDIDISTREGQDKVLSLAYKELVKRVTNKYKNPERAASNMFYDEDFPMELVSQYSRYQKHGFPDVAENNYKEQMPDSKEEYSAQDYANEMERDYKSQKEENAEDKNTNMWVSYFHRTFGPGYREEMIRNKLDPYEFFVDYYEWMKNDTQLVSRFANIYNSKYPENKVDVDRLVSMFNAIKDKPMVGYKAPGKPSENEERRLDPKCWKGYHKQGTKLKDGKRVNNCVKN